MKNELSKNIFSAAGQTIVQSVILLVLYRYLINRIGVDQLGIYSIVLATASAARVSELGFGGSIIKFVASYRAQGNDQAAAESLQTAAISVGAFFAIIVAIAYPLLLLALPHVLQAAGLDAGRTILPYCLVSLWLNSVSDIWMNALDACLRSGLRVGIMIFSSLLFLLLALPGVKYYGLVGLAGAQVAQGLFLVIAGWVFIRRVMKSLPKLPKQWTFERFREMLGYGINFQISSFLALLFEPATKILVGVYGGLSAAGYFEMAERMVIKVRALVVESNRVIVPVYAGMGSYEIDAPVLYVKHIRNLLIAAIPLFSFLVALMPAISEVWIGSFQQQFFLMGAWVSLAWFLNTISSPAYFAYLGQGKLYWITWAHMIMGTTNILAGLILGTIFGWQGVLAAFVGSLVLGSLIPVWAYHNKHHIKADQIISTSDVKLGVFLFGSAAISMASYLTVLDMSLFDRWSRVTIFTLIMGMVLILATWFHPLRKKILSSSFSRGRKKEILN